MASIVLRKQLVAHVRVPVDAQGNVDYESDIFARAVVGLSILCGKQFFNLDPMQNVDDLWREHGLLRLDLASFGAQINNSAQEHHCDIFVGNDCRISKHPL
eukprot:3532277-Rhodomonas_salina.1